MAVISVTDPQLDRSSLRQSISRSRLGTAAFRSLGLVFSDYLEGCTCCLWRIVTLSLWKFFGFNISNICLVFVHMIIQMYVSPRGLFGEAE